MSRLPFMKFYPADYLQATLDLSPDEDGIYLRLMMLAWRQPTGDLPDDDKFLSKNLRIHGNRWLKYKATVLARFFELIKVGDHMMWRNDRLFSEHFQAQKKSRKARENAQKRKSVSNENNDLGEADDSIVRSYSQKDKEKGKRKVADAPPPQQEAFDIPPDLDRREPKSKKGSRLKEDWTPDKQHIDYGIEQGFQLSDIEIIGEDFRDYWIGVSGAKGVKLDWLATWRTWVRRQKKFQEERGRPAKPCDFKVRFESVATPDEFRHNEKLKEARDFVEAGEFRKQVMERVQHG